MVLYRKYRPQKIAEIDSSQIREKLKAILSSSNPPHAFLFSGPKGTGKTSSARIIAKSLNCEKNQGKGEPCNQCQTCVSITNGTNLDILEIDAASNRGIDEIRDLRDKIKLAPTSSRKKIYIIDEVHMLTNEAFNALLKTLEEPPSHAVFILCTTNKEKVPETIISRCLTIDFPHANPQDLVSSLERVAKGEKKEIDREALEEIVKRCEGSYRDAHKLLEEVFLTYPQEKITTQKVNEVLGETQGLRELFSWINPPDAKKGLVFLEEIAKKGVDFKFLIQQILNTLHAHLLKKYQIIDKNLTYEPVLENLEIEELKFLINLFSQAALELRNAIIPQLPLQIAVVEWCENKKKKGGKEDKMIEPKSFKQINVRSQSLEEWEKFLAAVKPYNHSVAAVLRSCKPFSYDGQKLVIDVFYQFHYDKLKEAKVIEILEKAAETVFGKKIKVFPNYQPRT